MPNIHKPTRHRRLALEDPIKTLFIGEIQRNCEFASIAYDGNMVKYSHSMKAGDNKTLNRFWISVESFLVASANISKDPLAFAS